MNGTTRVLAAGELAPECIARLREDGLLVDEQAVWSEAELVAGVDGYDALIAGPGVPVTAAVLAAGHALRVVGRAGVDVVGIDVAEATRRGIVVVHAPDSGPRLRGRARAHAGACVRPRPGRRRRAASLRGCGVAASAGRRRRGARQDARPRRRAPRAPGCWPSARSRSA